MTWEALRAGRPAAPSPTSPHCSRPLRVPFRPRGGLDEARDAAGGNEAFSCQLPVTPSRVGVGVANLAPSVTSGSQLCVRVGKRGAEKKGWRGPVSERP